MMLRDGPFFKLKTKSAFVTNTLEFGRLKQLFYFRGSEPGKPSAGCCGPDPNGVS